MADPDGPRTMKRDRGKRSARDEATVPRKAVDRDALRSISEPMSDRQGSLPPIDEPEPADLGRYQLLFELARGGMGTVHVGRLRGAHGFDRLCAIKRLKADGATEEDMSAFLGEARLTASIKHPNVVQTLDVGEHDGLPFLVMDLIEGVSLARLQRRVKKAGDQLDPFVSAWIMSRVARGLHSAHELESVDGEPYGLVHRDVSPENVLLSFDGRVYVADFGVAKFTGADRQTQSGIVKGKFAYMSPEQTEAAGLDRRSDVFALGIVLHECLCGKRLFAGRSVADTIRRVWQLQPPDPRDNRPELPSDLTPIVMRCLEKNRDKRFDTAAAVAAALRALLKRHSESVDETDIAKLVNEYFPEERRNLKRRIRDAIHRADSDVSGSDTPVSSAVLEIASSPGTAPSAPVSEPTEQGSVTASVTTGPPMKRSGRGAWAAAAVAVVIAASFWLLSRDVDETRVEPASSAARETTTAARSTAQASTATTVVATTMPTASTTASTSASAPPPQPRAVPKTVVPRPKATPDPEPSHKGKPFQSLD